MREGHNREGAKYSFYGISKIRISFSLDTC